MAKFIVYGKDKTEYRVTAQNYNLDTRAFNSGEVDRARDGVWTKFMIFQTSVDDWVLKVAE